MHEGGTEESLVYGTHSSYFLGEIRMLPRRSPTYPAAHLGGLGLTGVFRVCAASYTSSHLAFLA